MTKDNSNKIIPLTRFFKGGRFVLFSDILRNERRFLWVLVGLFFLAGVVYPYPTIAMWLGFALAGYSAIANDSIQTIGTFIASNAQRKWYYLWLYIGLIFLVTVFFSWYVYDGDVSYQRLTTKGFDQAPQSFVFLQVAAPIVLLILTRLRMPVSTTFLLLSSFSTHPGAIIEVMTKSVSGYIVAFGVSVLLWLFLTELFSRWFKGKPGIIWIVFQWLSSGALWAIWIMQDAANIAIYLPRRLSLPEFLVFGGFIFLGLGLLFYLKGDKIQQIVTEKSDVTDVRSATIIDMVYAVILYFFKYVSVVPMSTTWVFIGLLAGRELAITLRKQHHHSLKKRLKRTLRIIGKDLLFALIGLVVSIGLACLVNPIVRDEIAAFLGV